MYTFSLQAHSGIGFQKHSQVFSIIPTYVDYNIAQCLVIKEGGDLLYERLGI